MHYQIFSTTILAPESIIEDLDKYQKDWSEK